MTTTATGFPMPKAIAVEESSKTATYAKFIAAPFQSGYGQTLGNSLRRVLLSSLEGAAICAVRIDGVSHEFDKLDHVIEDITDIVLNLKCIRLNLYGATSKTLEISKDKAGTVTAADIRTDNSVEVLNPEQVICTLDKSVPFRAEIDVISGRGYLPSEMSPVPRTIGTIPVDCIFSPVKRVNYHVSATRVGEATEMDSLELEIWTDGRLTPEKALENAAHILNDHLQPFLGGQAPGPGPEPTPVQLQLIKLLTQDIDVLELSVRAMNCLNSADIRLVGELCTKTEQRMLKFRNFGKKSLEEIKEKMEKFNLELGMTFSDAVINALDAKSQQIRAEKEEN